MKINLKAFALACSIFWGAALFLVTWCTTLIKRKFFLLPRSSLNAHGKSFQK